nr:hypothetical protein [Sedimentibacter sp.]
MILKGDSTHTIELGDSPHGNMVRLENVVKNLESYIGKLEDKIVEYNRNMEESKSEFEELFEHEGLLAEKSRRQFELDELLDINKGEEVITANEEELENSTIDSIDDEIIDKNNNSKRRSMSEVVNLVGKYKAENLKVEQEINNNMER